MNTIDIRRFVDLYGKYYFQGQGDADECKKYGIVIRHPVRTEYEEHIVCEKLSKGVYDKECIAWKLGVELSDSANEIGTRYHIFPVDQLNSFCRSVADEYRDGRDIEEMYFAIAQKAPKHIGTVQIINSLFFLSKGRIPIYDYYAHVAVKALINDKGPQEIYVGEAPSKLALSKGDSLDNSSEGTRHLLGVNLLYDYMDLLQTLKSMCCFSEGYWDKDGVFITRELDRALWVYGHCTRKWNEND